MVLALLDDLLADSLGELCATHWQMHGLLLRHTSAKNNPNSLSHGVCSFFAPTIMITAVIDFAYYRSQSSSTIQFSTQVPLQPTWFPYGAQRKSARNFRFPKNSCRRRSRDHHTYFDTH